MLDQKKQDDEIVDVSDLTGLLGYQIRQAQTAVFRDIEANMKAIGVTPGDFGLLTIVNANPGINQKSLTKLYGLDKSTLSYAVNRLIDRKWISRKRNPDDGRYFGLWLTKAGREKVEHARAEIDGQEELMDTVLKKGERQALLNMLDRISRLLSNSEKPAVT